MDNLTKAQRHKNMQNIRSQYTGPERIVFRELKKLHIYFSSYSKSLVGKPDIIFRKKKVIVFIDSDFWHCNPRRFTMPKSNVEYWENKIKKNKERDRTVNRLLRKQGWRVIRIWESDIKRDLNKVLTKIIDILNKEEPINQ